MNFRVEFNGETSEFEQFNDLIAFLTERLAQWNNFNPREQLSISLSKVPSGISTLGIDVTDELNLEDLLR